MTGRIWKLAVCACTMALCFALAACGGNSPSSSAASSAAPASTSEASSAAAADPAEKFVGDWKLAAAEMEGLTVTGDFSSGILGEDISMTLTLADDGTGATTFGDENNALKWELTGDDAIAITSDDSDGDVSALNATYKDGVLNVEMEDDEFSGTMYLTPDGKMEGVKTISTEGAKAITSEDGLAGTWKLTGASMMGMSMFGDADDLADMMGGDEDYAKLVINDDGSATIMGEDATWTVDSQGATIELEGVNIPMKDLDGDLVIDIGGIADSLGFDMVMLYTK